MIPTSVLSAMQTDVSGAITDLLPYVLPLFALVLSIGFIPKLVRKFTR